MARATALLLTVLTGFSGLVYEVAWQKYLATLLGSHSEATAAVLAIYLGGLAAGYALFGRVTARLVAQARADARPGRLLLLYGIVEAGIGVYALLFPWLFGGAQGLSLLLPQGNEALAFGIDVLLTVLLIAPPTILMGGTIPILTQALSESVEESTRVHAWVYAFNTAGAFLGALAGAFVLIPWLGLDGVMRAMAVLNLLAGAVFVALHVLRGGPAPAPTPDTPGASASPGSFIGYAAVALLAGFAMMTVQTVLNRVGALSFGASHFTFAMVVAVFVLCIATGSFIVSALQRIPPLLIVASQWALLGLLTLLYFGLPNAPYYAHAIRALFAATPYAFHPFYALAFAGILLVLLLPIGLAGALLPLIFHHLRREVGDLGAVAGRLYSWNTFGSLLGALLGGYALLFWLDLDQVFAVALAAIALCAGLLTVVVLRWPPVIPAAVGFTLAAVLGVASLPDWDPNRLSSGLFRIREAGPWTFSGPKALFASKRAARVIFHVDDPTSTVVVKEGKGRAQSRALVNNGKPDGHITADYPTMALISLVPALFADDLTRSFVVGYGTGVSAGELAALEETREVVVAEISSGVLEAAPLFDAGNLRASRSPKLRLIRSDAYRALLRSEGRYGAIVSEPSNPWVAGVEMLFSEEFLRAARSKLTPGGVYGQWFHLYEVDPETVSIVLRSYDRVFEKVAIWTTLGPDILLLGFNDDEATIDLPALRARFARPDLRAGFARASVDSWEELATHELLSLGTLGAAELEGPTQTLRHPILSDQAARAFFLGDSARLPRFVGPKSREIALHNSILRRTLEALPRPIPEQQLRRLAVHACEMTHDLGCPIFLARLRADHPDSDWRAVLDANRSRAFVSGAPDPELVIALSRMVRGEPAEAQGGRGNGAANARRTTALFTRYFHPGMPFDPAVVARAWDECPRTAPRAACAEGRKKAESSLGPLGSGAELDTSVGALGR